VKGDITLGFGNLTRLKMVEDDCMKFYDEESYSKGYANGFVGALMVVAPTWTALFFSFKWILHLFH